MPSDRHYIANVDEHNSQPACGIASEMNSSVQQLHLRHHLSLARVVSKVHVVWNPPDYCRSILLIQSIVQPNSCSLKFKERTSGVLTSWQVPNLRITCMLILIACSTFTSHRPFRPLIMLYARRPCQRACRILTLPLPTAFLISLARSAPLGQASSAQQVVHTYCLDQEAVKVEA